jgi:hypothetical protein
MFSTRGAGRSLSARDVTPVPTWPLSG